MTHTIRKTKTLAAAMLSMLIIFAACKKDEPVINAASVTISAADDFILAIGQDTTLTASVLPETTTDKTIAWTVVQEAEIVALAETAEGVTIEAKGTGAATITATAASGATASVTVNVEEESVSISAAEDFSLAIGQDTTLTASVLPEVITDKSIIWTVEPATGVVNLTLTVEGVTVRAAEGVSYGEGATITATSASGKSASVMVTISPEGVNINGEGVWEIYTEEGLKAFAKAVNGTTDTEDYNSTNAQLNLNAKLMQDITLTATGESNWTPIGWRDGGYYGYYGIFDGNDKSISGLQINSKENYIGLFGSLYNDSGSAKMSGTVKNTTLIDPIVNGANYIGAIAGIAFGAIIENCSLEGKNASIKGVNFVGGFVGYGAPIITACYNSVSVEGTSDIGGFVGDGRSATITACNNVASVKGTGNNIGGIVGWGDRVMITACYNAASVTGNKDVGGIVGYGGSATINTIYWIDVADDSATTAIGGGTPSTSVGSMDATDLATLNDETAMGALNAAIPETVAYKFVKGDSTPKLVKGNE